MELQRYNMYNYLTFKWPKQFGHATNALGWLCDIAEFWAAKPNQFTRWELNPGAPRLVCCLGALGHSSCSINNYFLCWRHFKGTCSWLLSLVQTKSWTLGPVGHRYLVVVFLFLWCYLSFVLFLLSFFFFLVLFFLHSSIHWI